MIDTNTLAILVAALQQKSSSLPSSNLTLILVTLTPLLAAVAAWFAKKTAASVDLIHTAVNSERTATLQEIKSLKDEVLKLSEKIAFSEGQKESQANELLASAVISASKKVQDSANQPN